MLASAAFFLIHLPIEAVEARSRDRNDMKLNTTEKYTEGKEADDS
jgi:hypothetical protein